MAMSALLKNHHKSPFCANNLNRCDEPVASDTIYYDTPTIVDSSKCTHVFVGNM